jgi:hypothetical protein
MADFHLEATASVNHLLTSPSTLDLRRSSDMTLQATVCVEWYKLLWQRARCKCSAYRSDNRLERQPDIPLDAGVRLAYLGGITLHL